MLRYRIHKDLKFIYAAGEGTLTAHEINNHLDELLEDPAYTPPMLKLVDYRKVKEYQFSNKEAEIFSKKKASMAKHFSQEKCAILVASDLGFGIARLHQAFIDEKNIKTEVFRNLEDAQKWLGVDISDKDWI